MAAVYFLAYRGESPLSRLIRFVTAGDYSHIGLAVCVGSDHSIHLWAPSDSKRPVRDFSAWGHWPWEACVRDYDIDREHKPGTRVDLFKLPCTEQEAQAILNFYLKHEGAPYDWLGALTSIVRPTRQGKKRWFCSEIAYAACLSAGVRLLNETRPHKVTPRIFCLSPYLKLVGQFTTEKEV